MLDIKAPTIVDIRDLKLNIMKKHMDADPAVRINMLQNMLKQQLLEILYRPIERIEALGVYEKKQAIEADFTAFANSTDSNKVKYGEALSLIEQAYAASDATEKGANFLSEVGIRGTDVILFTYRANRTIEQLLSEEDADKKAELIARLQASAAEHFKNYNAALDEEQFAKLFAKYQADVDASQHPSFLLI